MPRAWIGTLKFNGAYKERGRRMVLHSQRKHDRLPNCRSLLWAVEIVSSKHAFKYGL